jgi:hypothetical protein
MFVQTNWFYEFILLAKRNLLNQVRLPNVVGVRILVTIIISFIAVLIYNDMDGSKAGV